MTKQINTSSTTHKSWPQVRARILARLKRRHQLGHILDGIIPKKKSFNLSRTTLTSIVSQRTFHFALPIAKAATINLVRTNRPQPQVSSSISPQLGAILPLEN